MVEHPVIRNPTRAEREAHKVGLFRLTCIFIRFHISERELFEKQDLLFHPRESLAAGPNTLSIHLFFDGAMQANFAGIPDQPLGVLRDAATFGPECRCYGTRRIARVIRYA